MIRSQFLTMIQKFRSIGARWVNLSFEQRDPQQVFGRWLRSFAPFTIILLLDPFGCSQIADRYSEDIVMRIASPFHNGGWDGQAYRSTLGQKKVAVVLIDQAWLDARNEKRSAWPPPRSVQINEILHPILSQSPEAVLFDYTFSADKLGEAAPSDPAGSRSTDPESPEKIREMIETERAEHKIIEGYTAGNPISGQPTRIFFGSKPIFKSAKNNCDVQSTSNNEVVGADDVAVTLRHWDEKPDQPSIELLTLRSYASVHYALLPYAIDKESTSAECRMLDQDTTKPPQYYLASPAYALFFAYCERDQKANENTLCKQRGMRKPLSRTAMKGQTSERATAVTGFQTPIDLVPSYQLYPGQPLIRGNLALVWPAFRSSQQFANHKMLTETMKATDLGNHLNRCKTSHYGPISEAAVLAGKLFLASLWHSRDTMEQREEPCRYGVDTYNIITLTALTGMAASDDLARGPPLRGRYVLVGLELASDPDIVPNPLYQEAPGVLFHAIALENLISMEHKYIGDEPPQLLDWGVSSLGVIFLIGLLLSIVPILIPVDHGVQLLLKAHRRLWIGKILVIGFIVAILTVPLIIGIILTVTLRLAPLNWMSLLPAIVWAPEIAYQQLDDFNAQSPQSGTSKLWQWVKYLIIAMIGIFVTFWFCI